MTETITERPAGPAMRHGLRRRCPSCGTGPLFDGYLTVRDSCPDCGEDLTPQRADDGPAYLTLLIVGHLMAPLLLIVYSTFRPEPLVMAAIFTTGTEGNPNALPRPVVNRQTLQPPAAMPVTEVGS